MSSDAAQDLCAFLGNDRFGGVLADVSGRFTGPAEILCRHRRANDGSNGRDRRPIRAMWRDLTARRIKPVWTSQRFPATLGAE